MEFLFKIKVRYKNEEKQSFERISLSKRERKKDETEMKTHCTLLSYIQNIF